MAVLSESFVDLRSSLYYRNNFFNFDRILCSLAEEELFGIGF